MAKKIPIKPTKASRAGMNYQAANGTKIKNYGEKRLEGQNGHGRDTAITIQCAEVKKVLGSVSRMNEAGNTVIFSKGRSAIIRDPNSEIAERAIREAKAERTTELRREKGVYKFDLWIPGGEEINEIHEETESEEITEGFAWLDGEIM